MAENLVKKLEDINYLFHQYVGIRGNVLMSCVDDVQS